MKYERFLPEFTRSDLLNPAYIKQICCNIEAFVGRPNCRYFEVGAFDGLFQTNTLHLNRELGWTGVLVEPSRPTFEACKVNRPNDIVVHSALGSDTQAGSTLTFALNGPQTKPLSDLTWLEFAKLCVKTVLGRSPTETVRFRTTKDVLASVGVEETQFVSLDVEGHELNVLKGMDLDRMNVLALLIEIRPHNMLPIMDLLIEHGFMLADSLSRFNNFDIPGWTAGGQDYLYLRQDFVKFLCQQTDPNLVTTRTTPSAQQ